MGGEKVIEVNGVGLCVDTVGDRGNPAILLISGMSSSMDWWDDEFCQRLADGGRFVVRYDHRDTGRSVTYPQGKPEYTGLDLVADAVGILDALGLARAHLTGISMGGAIAQRIAIEHPGRVESLVLLSTSPGGPAADDLPPMSPELAAHYASSPAMPDWSDRAAVVDHIVDDERRLSSPEYFDEAQVRVLAERVLDRATDIAAMTNHWLAGGGGPIRSRLPEVTAPTLVIHGTADPLFPYGHGEALAREIPHAELLPLDGVGHQMPPRELWDEVVDAILFHTFGGWERQANVLAERSLAAGDATGWFDVLYAAGASGEVPMPWNRTAPHPLLEGRVPDHARRRAVVVGSGLGEDAEYVAALGYDTVGFDIAETAVRVARERHPGSAVDYRTANLLDLPSAWERAFDLVIEVFTVQALPDPPRSTAIANVARLVAPGGALIVIAFRHDGADEPEKSIPPWPLKRDEINAFTSDGLVPVRIEELDDPRRPGTPHWRAEFQRPA